MPKVRNEFRGFAEVYSTEPRAASVPVDVNMKHADFTTEGNLHGLSYSRWAHHCTHSAIVKVVIIGHGMKIVCENDPACGLQSAHSAREKSHSLSCKWMGPA
ncbi:MAG: hypothetical protein ACLPVW_16805 [Terriglobales bacterium]